MSMRDWLELVGWTAITLLVGMLFDMGMKYRLQLTYSASHKGSSEWTPRFATTLSVRHLFVLLMAFFIQYIHRIQKIDQSTGLIVLAVLFLIYGAFLLRDSIRDLRRDSAP